MNSISIYPNPSSGTTFSVDTNLPVALSVFDILGKQVITTTVTPNNNTISIADLNSGIYLVKLEYEGKSSTKKLIKR